MGTGEFANDEVLFLFKLNKTIKFTMFTKFFKGSSIGSSLSDSNLYSLICLLKLVLPKVEYESLIVILEEVLNKYKTRFRSVYFSDIIKLSGFSFTWKSDIT